MAAQRIPQGPALHARDVARGVREYGVRRATPIPTNMCSAAGALRRHRDDQIIDLNDAVGSPTIAGVPAT